MHRWRQLPNHRDWKVTPETADLISHWRSQNFEYGEIRPFFCQVEAVETAIWLREVAPKMGKQGSRILNRLKITNETTNPDLFRIALKLATGAGKTIVMAMLIAWQTVNAVKYPQSKSFSRAFLIVTPGITIKDRLRVLQPDDPDSYYTTKNLIPSEMVTEMAKAKIVITNYHAFKLRETMNIPRNSQNFLRGRLGTLQTKETDGQMVKRVLNTLVGMKNIVVMNDEAHHCYRENREQPPSENKHLQGDEKKEAEKSKEAARIWITGIETVKRVLGVRVVYDLSATPFFMKGSGYAEGTLFPWVCSDFSLMDAIESGIVKLPRVPIADNAKQGGRPIFRFLWDHIGHAMPKKRQNRAADPGDLPLELKTALDSLYGHYEGVFKRWQEKNIAVPPVFIVVCNNTATSKLVYDYISGFDRGESEDERHHVPGRLALFQNYDQQGIRLPRPHTLLIDSLQLESGDALDDKFREAAAGEIEQFRANILARTGNQKDAEHIDDATLLREVMNTVGKPGALGEQIRCVVSVSMLTEGWDANTVTHILGVRAFGTQLLCEQVIGRALRRRSYRLPKEGLFSVEYANILGVPFDFVADPPDGDPVVDDDPVDSIHVYAERDRDALEIRFPNVKGYRTELPPAMLIPNFTDDHKLRLTSDIIRPSRTKIGGILGEETELTLGITKDTRDNTIIYKLASHLLCDHYQDANEVRKNYLFMPLVKICRYWLEHYLECGDGTYPAQVLYSQVIEMAAQKIKAAITETHVKQDKNLVKAVLSSYNNEGSSIHVNFSTSNVNRYQTSSEKCHVNWVIGDSDWELKMAAALEKTPRVLAYVKNHALGFEVPYLFQSNVHKYRPDFIAKIDDGILGDPLHLIIEVKGYRNEAAVEKSNTMHAFWVPGVNHLKEFGRWEFVEFQGEIFQDISILQETLDSLLDGFAQKHASQ